MPGFLAGVLCWAVPIFGLSHRASGHSDPWGDIHPQVLVTDGRFAVVFNSSLPDQEAGDSDRKPVYRAIFNPDGTLVAPRHPVGRKRFWKKPWWDTEAVGSYGRSMVVDGATVVFETDSGGRPGYLLKSPDGGMKRVRLPWPKGVELILLEDAMAVPEGVAMTGKEDEEILKFYWFPHGSTAEPAIRSIGETMCIYHFPVASNVAFAGGRFWVAFMRAEEEEVKLVLWSWNPEEREAREEVLDSPGFWNSHLSLAAIGDRLCLAYHCAGPDEGYNLARIVTVFRKAE